MSKLSKFIREKITKTYKFKSGNHFFIKEGSNLKETKKIIKGLKLHLGGNNNTLIIDKDANFEDTTIRIGGKNNTLELGKIARFFNSEIHIAGKNNIAEIKDTKYPIRTLGLYMGGDTNDRIFKIDNNFSCLKTSIYLNKHKSKLTIGKNCMFSSDIIIMTADGHPIYDKDTNEYINPEGEIVEIGDHVWVGRRVTINKRAKIPSNSVVGLNSFVLHPFSEENIVIAGNPAKIIKRNIRWQRNEFVE